MQADSFAEQYSGDLRLVRALAYQADSILQELINAFLRVTDSGCLRRGGSSLLIVIACD